MSREAIINEVKELKEGYALFSPFTNLPYIECEEETYNDTIFMFANKEDSIAAAKELVAKGEQIIVKEMKTVGVEVPVNPAEPNGEKKQMFLNQVRQHLGSLPFIGVNAVSYKPADGEAETVELTALLPEGFEKKVEVNVLYNPNLQLTGAYLMQEVRKPKEKRDAEYVHELDEEFSSNLVNSKLFIAVMPPEGKERDDKLDLKECKMPYLKRKNGDVFFPIFTDIWEFQKYVQGKKLRSIQIPFKNVANFWVKDAKAYMINPMGSSIPLMREVLPKLIQRFGKEEE